jgi:hypothetical protein
MYDYPPGNIEEITRKVKQHLEDEDTYLRERMEAFDIKKDFWLTEAIKNALRRIYGWFDESLVELIKRLLGF